MDVITKFARDLIRYGKIINIKDRKKSDGYYRTYFIKSEKGTLYKIIMRNGNVISLKRNKGY